MSEEQIEDYKYSKVEQSVVLPDTIGRGTQALPLRGSTSATVSVERSGLVLFSAEFSDAGRLLRLRCSAGEEDAFEVFARALYAYAYRQGRASHSPFGF